MKTKLKTMLAVALFCVAGNVSGQSADDVIRAVLAHPERYGPNTVRWAYEQKAGLDQRDAARYAARREADAARMERERQEELERRLDELEARTRRNAYELQQQQDAEFWRRASR